MIVRIIALILIAMPLTACFAPECDKAIRELNKVQYHTLSERQQNLYNELKQLLSQLKEFNADDACRQAWEHSKDRL